MYENEASTLAVVMCLFRVTYTSSLYCKRRKKDGERGEGGGKGQEEEGGGRNEREGDGTREREWGGNGTGEAGMGRRGWKRRRMRG